MLNKISGKDTQIKNVSDFVNRLPYPTIETAIEHLNISGKILHHKEVKESALSPTAEIMSLDGESELSRTYEDSGYGSSLDEGHEYEKVSHYQEEKSEILEKSLQNLKLPKEEPIYATIPIEHIEAKRKRKQEKQSKHTVSPKLPKAIKIAEKISFAGQQESQGIFKDISTILEKSKNPGNANQKMSTKPRIVGVILKKSIESIPLRAENQGYRQVVQEVEVPVVKEVVNRKMDSKVKEIVEKFEQKQVKECADMQPSKSKGTMIAQSRIDMKTNPLVNLVMEQCDRKPCKNSSLTHVNVKQLAAQFENYGKR